MAGRLDRRITLRRAKVTTNELGEDVQTWTDLATVWAQRTDAGGTEQIAAGELASTMASRFRIRWTNRFVLTPRDRLRVGDLEFDIVSAVEIGRREGIDIMTRARSD
jgi:SPP1 family predicted phage head-tail adaptor